MFDEELNTSIANFKQLWQAGIVEAHLAIDSHAGRAGVHLHIPLGQALGPLPHPVQPHYQPTRRNKNTPSRQRRRARRAAARDAQAGTSMEQETELKKLCVMMTVKLKWLKKLRQNM